jgi:hypothetical protein
MGGSGLRCRVSLLTTIHCDSASIPVPFWVKW